MSRLWQYVVAAVLTGVLVLWVFDVLSPGGAFERIRSEGVRQRFEGQSERRANREWQQLHQEERREQREQREHDVVPEAMIKADKNP
jgi:hypothetical protein